MSDMTDAAGRIDCESHHWVSTNVPGLLTRWVIQCSLCGVYNVEEMNAAALSAAGSGPAQGIKHEAWDGGYRAGWADRTRSLMERRTYEEEVAKATPNPWPETG